MDLDLRENSDHMAQLVEKIGRGRDSKPGEADKG